MALEFVAVRSVKRPTREALARRVLVDLLRFKPLTRIELAEATRCINITQPAIRGALQRLLRANIIGTDEVDGVVVYFLKGRT